MREAFAVQKFFIFFFYYYFFYKNIGTFAVLNLFEILT